MSSSGITVCRRQATMMASSSGVRTVAEPPWDLWEHRPPSSACATSGPLSGSRPIALPEPSGSIYIAVARDGPPQSCGRSVKILAHSASLAAW